MGGTGGGLLSYLIDAASSERSIEQKPEHTQYGSSHLMWPRFLISSIITMPVEQQIQALKDTDFSYNFGNPKTYTTPTYYAFHCTDIDLAMQYTNKTILINYDIDDAYDIAKVFLGKRHLDGFYFPDGQRFYTEKDDLAKLRDDYKSQYEIIVNHQSTFMPRHDYGDRLLNLSWKELINCDAREIIERISGFTDLDASKFDTDTLIEWQKRTHFCLTDLEPLVQKLLKEDNE